MLGLLGGMAHGRVLSRLAQEVAQMNDDILAGKWKQVKGNARQWWSKLTDDDIDRMTGKTEELAGKLQERYGWSRERATDEINRRLRELDAAAARVTR